MLQRQSRIEIKDNSGLFEGRIIDASTCNNAGLGMCVKAVVIRARADKNLGKMKDVLVIQTKKTQVRMDGSTLKFSKNSGVCVTRALNRQGKKRLTLNFKRIKTSVSYEQKHNRKLHTSNINLIKLAPLIL